MSDLLPDGVLDVKDVPYTFFDAVRSAMVILSFDDLPSEERPPRRMWRDGEKLKEFFDAVQVRREEKYSSSGSAGIEDPVSNDAASSLIVD